MILLEQWRTGVTASMMSLLQWRVEDVSFLYASFIAYTCLMFGLCLIQALSLWNSDQMKIIIVL
jgi:hypothetical protein